MSSVMEPTDNPAVKASTPTLNPQACKSMFRSSGFTLIEVLVVMVIVGVMSTALTLGIEGLSLRSDERELQRLRVVLEACAERALTRGQSVSVEFFADGYRLSALDFEDKWIPLFDPPLFTERALPTGFTWAGLSAVGQRDSTRLVFGSRSPEFTLRVGTHNGEARLLGSTNGEVLLETPGASARSGGTR